MDLPEYISIDGVKVKIHTDYRDAIKCQEIMNDKNISNIEKAIGIIYTIFDVGNINISDNYERWLKAALKYLSAYSTNKHIDNKPMKIDMDYIKDWDLIVASMWRTYGIDINKEKIHWWTFYSLLNGLPSDCILNQVRDIRTRDISKEKDREVREKIIELKKVYSLEEDKKLTLEQAESVKRFYELAGIERKE